MTDPFQLMLEHVRQRRGVDLSGYRPATLRRRFDERRAQAGEPDPEAYLVRLRADPEECDRLLSMLAVNVSSFFRDPIVSEILEQTVLPVILEQKKQQGGSDLRIWSAACGSGEEPYTLAILLHRLLSTTAADLTPLVFGTDINPEALRQAEDAVYPRERLQNVKLGVLERYFTERGGCFEVIPEVRDLVRFSFDDLTKPGLAAPAESIFGGFDLVLCRNVLIYFSEELQERVLEKLQTSLVPGGYLVLGSAEQLTVAVQGRFEVVDHRNRIYRKRGGKRLWNS